MSKSTNKVFDTRKRLGLTQTELADKLDMSLGYIYKLEKGKKPIGTKLVKKLEQLENNDNSTKSNNEKSKVFINKETEISVIDILTKQVNEAREREKIHLEIIKNLSKKGCV